MTIHPRHVWPAVAAALALMGAGCGEERDGGTAGGERGGTLTVLSQGDVDSLDPGFHYYQYDYMALSMPTQRALYGWRPQDTRPSPDLADGMPRVSADGRTVTVRIKPGIRYSDPVNRAVASRDVKYAIERGFLPQVGNGYAKSYFGDLEGVEAFTDGKAREIAGLEAPDDRTLVFRLAKPTGVIANANALALPLTVPVPKEYAARFDTGKQSTYGQHQVFTGPYMLPHDRTGKVTRAGYDPGKRIVLVRNPAWSRATDFRPAHLDRIELLGGNDLTVASRKVLGGRSMVSGDYGAPPPAVLKQALERNEDQLEIIPSGGNRYIALNTRVEPFDDLNVRRAVAAAIDRNALRLTRGGPTVGEIATHFIPPNIPGFEEAGGREASFDFMEKPAGDMALAASYLKQAGFEGGKYDGEERLLMVGDDEPPASKTGEAVQAKLQDLGFRLNYRQVPHETAQQKFCGTPKARVAICPNLGWGKDFYDGQSLIDPTFNGKNIVPVGNVNVPQLDDPEINAAIERAKQETDPAARARAWGELDRRITGLAVVIPWLWDNQINLRSANVNGVSNRFNSSWDLSFTSLK
ncbi:MAG: ABC transporter substrate-binding protein [Actinomycetota bacterium]|nr:ABC transporter substrate-binding protein [Actinomycetota bacterium]